MLVVVAHPDDETFGTGGLIAHQAARGFDVVVCCATRGEAGEPPSWLADGVDLGVERESELRAAAAALGVSRVVVLDFADSGMQGEAEPTTLAGARFEAVVDAVAEVIGEVDPDVVVTLDPEPTDGHRDHTRIGRATVEACRAYPTIWLYAWTVPRPLLARWFEELERVRPGAEHLDLERDGLGRPMEDVTTILDTADVRAARERATALHRSQTSPFDDMPEDLRTSFLTTDHLIRIQPPWTTGAVEQHLGHRS
jgi:LmbE family N-acetylglucosaminyl deacetylase